MLEEKSRTHYNTVSLQGWVYRYKNNHAKIGCLDTYMQWVERSHADLWTYSFIVPQKKRKIGKYFFVA